MCFRTVWIQADAGTVIKPDQVGGFQRFNRARSKDPWGEGVTQFWHFLDPKSSKKHQVMVIVVLWAGETSKFASPLTLSKALSQSFLGEDV
jgi:hypothetical protein